MLNKSLHFYHKNHIVQTHVIYLQCWVTSGWWMCLTEYHTLGMLQHFPSYQNTASKKNCYRDMMRIDLFLPSAVYVGKTFTNNWPKFVYYSYFPSHKYYTSPPYRICCSRTLWPPPSQFPTPHPPSKALHACRHWFKVSSFWKAADKSSASFRDSKNPCLVHLFNVQHLQ